MRWFQGLGLIAAFWIVAMVIRAGTKGVAPEMVNEGLITLPCMMVLYLMISYVFFAPMVVYPDRIFMTFVANVNEWLLFGGMFGFLAFIKLVT